MDNSLTALKRFTLLIRKLIVILLVLLILVCQILMHIFKIYNKNHSTDNILINPVKEKEMSEGKANTDITLDVRNATETYKQNIICSAKDMAGEDAKLGDETNVTEVESVITANHTNTEQGIHSLERKKMNISKLPNELEIYNPEKQNPTDGSKITVKPMPGVYMKLNQQTKYVHYVEECSVPSVDGCKEEPCMDEVNEIHPLDDPSGEERGQLMKTLNGSGSHCHDESSNRCDYNYEKFYYSATIDNDPNVVAIQSKGHLVDLADCLDLDYFRRMLHLHSNNNGRDEASVKQKNIKLFEDLINTLDDGNKSYTSKVVASKSRIAVNPSSSVDQNSHAYLEISNVNTLRGKNVKNGNVFTSEKKNKRKKKKFNDVKVNMRKQIGISNFEMKNGKSSILKQSPVSLQNRSFLTTSNPSSVNKSNFLYKPTSSLSTSSSINSTTLKTNTFKSSLHTENEKLSTNYRFGEHLTPSNEADLSRNKTYAQITKVNDRSAFNSCEEIASQHIKKRNASIIKLPKCSILNTTSAEKVYRKSKIRSVNETGFIVDGRSEIKRVNCFLFGVSLSEISLINIFKTDQVVEFALKKKENVEQCWIGKSTSSNKRKYELLKEYCQKHKIDINTKCALLQLTDYVPEDCAPIPTLPDTTFVSI